MGWRIYFSMGMEKIEKKLIEVKPNKEIQNLLIEVANLNKSGHLEKLEKILRKIILLDPNYYPAFFHLARLLEKAKRIPEAIEFYKKTLKINSSHFESMINLTNCYEDIKKFDKAIEISEKCCKLYPDKYEIHYNLGRLCHTKVIDLDKAIHAFKKSLAINNNFMFARISLGQVYKSQGNFNKAKKIFQKIVDTDVNKIRAYYEMAETLDTNEIKNTIKKLEVLENDDKQADKEKIYLYFAMGKIYEKINNYNKAFHYFDLGNKLKKKNIGSIDFKWEEKKFEALKKILKKFKTKNFGYQSSKPIFIVGMPRSGSTLIEQIISSHSEVFGGGELFHFTDFFEKVSIPKKNKNLIDVLDYINEKNFFDIGKKYVEEIEKISKKHKYFTNKYLSNVFNILLIKLALPNAKIIHCERNALDICLSCYKTNFTEGSEFSYSLEEIGNYYLEYKKQIEYWNKIFMKQILNIKYEDFVNNIEKETKKVLDFLELDFEENCLKFYKNKRSVNTASLVQVRQPIYKGSVNSWTNYKKYLKNLINKLNV